MIGDQTQQAQQAGLDQYQLADVVNRQKLGSQRQRNEMMRMGTQDPGAFALQNKQTLQQAQQPSEFWGAGRKEVPVGTDESLLNAIGGSSTNLGGSNYYYSPLDVSKASWGTQDSNDTDLGNGKYAMMDNGTMKGVGYKSLADTIKDYQMKQYAPKATEQWQSMPTPDNINENIAKDPNYLAANNMRAGTPSLSQVYNPLSEAGYSMAETPTWEKLAQGFSAGGQGFYNTEAEAQAAQQQLGQQHITGNATQDWETLGQLLNYGKVTGNWDDSRSIGGNNQADPIKGLDTLYGSKPLMYNGKMLGYNQQSKIDPLTARWNEQSDDISRGGFMNQRVSTQHNYDVGGYDMGRNYNDPSWWSQNTQGNPNGTYTTTAENAANSPGWSNADQFQRQHGSETSTKAIGGLRDWMSGIGSVVDLLVPWTYGTAKYVGANTADMIGGKSFSETADSSIKNQLPMWAATYGLGTLLGGATGGDPGGTAPTTSEAYIDAGGMGGTSAGSNLGGQLGSAGGLAGYLGASNNQIISGYSPTYAGVANSAIGGAASGAITGGAQGALRGGLGGALGNAAGGYAAGSTESLGTMLSKMAGGAASGSINSLFNKDSPINGSLYGAMSGGLHGYLNSTNNASDNFSNSQDQKNKQTAQQATSLAKTLMKLRKK